MENVNWMALVEQTQMQKVRETNQYTEKFGLVLSEQDAQLLAQERKNTLAEQRRVEFGESILPGSRAGTLFWSVSNKVRCRRTRPGRTWCEERRRSCLLFMNVINRSSMRIAMYTLQMFCRGGYRLFLVL